MSAPRPSSLVRLPTRPRSRASRAARAALSPARAASARFAPAALSLAALALASACSDGGVDRADGPPEIQGHGDSPYTPAGGTRTPTPAGPQGPSPGATPSDEARQGSGAGVPRLGEARMGGQGRSKQ